MNLVQHLDILAARKLHGRTKFQGLDISIENRKGSTRSGVARDGTKWATTMTYPYGYIRKTEANDGDHVDCFIGPNMNASKAYVIHIMHPDTKKYDEDKVFLGFANAKAAKKAFDANYDRPERFYQGMTVMTMEKFKQTVLAKENHGDKIAAGELGGFVSSMHLDMLPHGWQETPKTGKSIIKTPDQEAYNQRLLQQKYAQPHYVERAASDFAQGSTTPFAYTQVYAGGPGSGRHKEGDSSADAKAYPKSIKQLNKIFEQNGIKERVAKVGSHIFYTGGNAHLWYSSSADVARINHLSIGRWLEDVQYKIKEYEKYK